MTQDDPGALREYLRRLRRGLSPEQQTRATGNLFELILAEPFFRESRRVAFYVAVDGEISPGPLLRHALDEGKDCYLPVVAGEHELEFVLHHADSPLEKNHWNIPEPVAGAQIRPDALDLVFVPLTGFTRDCDRLGNGKGYYDRAFAFHMSGAGPRPMLVGLAHECQLLESLPVRHWDVPLDAVATSERIFYRA